MMKYILKICFILVFCLCRETYAADLLGPAEYILKSVSQCPHSEKYISKLVVQRKKINRTHDAFDADADFATPCDEKTRFYANAAKWGDGGYKPNAYIIDEMNACNFFMQWANKGFKELMALAGQPPTCPLKAGKYKFKNYMIDYRQLPAQMIYGEFRMDAKFFYEEKEVMCLQVFGSVKPKNLFG